MSTVGQGFGSFNRTSRRTPRAPLNPLDKSTIVSFFPAKIVERKHTIFPGEFIIEKAEPNDFSILVLTQSSWWKDVDSVNENQPMLEIPASSLKMAESVIKDYFNGFIGCDMGEHMPAVFFVPGEYSKATIATYTAPDGTKFKTLCDRAKEKQTNWYKKLVEIADIDWARTGGNPISISDFSKLAAQHLKLEKPWTQNITAFQLDSCPACGQLTNLMYPVCKHCKAIVNPERAKELNLKFASV